MKKNHKFTFIMTLVASLGLLAGCAELSEKKIEEGVNKKVEEAVNSGVEKVNDALAKTAEYATLDWFDEAKKDGTEKKLSLTQEVGSVKSVRLHNEVGNIEVKAASGDQITVSTAIWASKSSSHKDDIQAILDSAVTEVIADGDQLKIVTHPKDDPDRNLWDWAHKKYGYSEFIIEYTVEIPTSVNRFEISSSVGNISLSGLNGTYDVHSDVGTIRLDGARIVGESRVKSETGSLKLGIDQMDSGSSLKAATEVGSINATLADSLECDLKTNTELGQVTGATPGLNKINGGGPQLSLNTSVGAITVE